MPRFAEPSSCSASNRFVLNRHVWLRRPGFPEAHQSLAGQQRAGTGIRASDSERGSRGAAAARQQEDQRGLAGSRSERSEEGTSTHQGHAGAGLLCARGHFASRDLHLVRGQHPPRAGTPGPDQLLEWTLAQLAPRLIPAIRVVGSPRRLGRKHGSPVEPPTGTAATPPAGAGATRGLAVAPVRAGRLVVADRPVLVEVDLLVRRRRNRHRVAERRAAVSRAADQDRRTPPLGRIGIDEISHVLCIASKATLASLPPRTGCPDWRTAPR